MNKPRSILFIGDDPGDVQLVSRTLRSSQQSFRVDHATTLSQVTELFSSAEYDLILADVSPDSLGFETVSQLRKMVPDTPIIALTSVDDDDVCVKLLDAGAQNYLPKKAISGKLLDHSIRRSLQGHDQLLQNNALLREINELRDRLAAKDRMLESVHRQAHDFADDLAHAFRTPLTVVKEYAALMGEGLVGTVSPEQARMLLVIENRADDMDSMVDDMLDSSKLDAGVIDVWRKPCNVNDIVALARKSLDRKAEAKNVKLIWECATDLPTVYCDSEQVGRVIANLGINAFKFCGEPGEVCIQVYQVSGNAEVTFAIKGNGAGFASAKKQRISENLHQLGATTRSRSKELGLGLAIAKELVELNFGELSVVSETDWGNAFAFTVPANSPLEITTRYMRFIKQSQELPHAITLVLVQPRSGQSTSNEPEDYLNEDFLKKLCRYSDLLLPCPNGEFLIAFPADGNALQTFEERRQLHRENCDRNRPHAPLSEAHYDRIGTWQIETDSERITRVVEELTSATQVAIGTI